MRIKDASAGMASLTDGTRFSYVKSHKTSNLKPLFFEFLGFRVHAGGRATTRKGSLEGFSRLLSRRFYQGALKGTELR